MKKSDLPFIPPFYYKYINLVPDNMELISGLVSTRNNLYALREHFTGDESLSYFRNKWTVKDVLQHNIDNERIQAYRALALSRGEINTLPGYNRELYAKYAYASKREVDHLIKEFVLVRNSTIALFESFSESMLLKQGLCSGAKLSVAALGFLTIGNTIRHSNIITQYFLKPQSKSSSS